MSIQTIALRVADTLAGMTGILDRPLRSQDMIRRAQQQTGLTDFGDFPIAEPLERLLASCSDEAALGVIGRSATFWDVVRFLSNLLQMRAAEVETPAILSNTVAKPIFITGLPRSGTTFLHRLMMQDTASRAPLVWETIYPFPQAGKLSLENDPRPDRVARQLRIFEYLAPEFRGLHPLDARDPQECSEITAHVFRSLRFDTNYDVPSYRAWLDGNHGENLPAYAFHKRFLQHLQHQDRRGRRADRWVLKCPEHLFALDAIKTIYPDARLVFVHRDPVKVLLSQTKLTEVLRRPFTRRMDVRNLGRHESARWLDGAHRMLAIGDDAGLPDPVCHVHHMDLITDPLATVEAVYHHFNDDLPAPARAAIGHYVRARPNGGYGRHSYSFEDHGLNEAEEREKFRAYLVGFGIAAETGDNPVRHTMPARHAQAQQTTESF